MSWREGTRETKPAREGMRRMQTGRAKLGRRARAIAAAAVAAALTSPVDALAQEASPSGKAIAGGALLGAEAVMLTEAAFGVEPAWAYLVGGGVGAGAGVVGGIFLEKSIDARTSMLILAGGMVLAVPTTVAVLSATAYNPPADYVYDRPPEPAEEPPTVPTDTPPTFQDEVNPAGASRSPRPEVRSARLRLRPPPQSLVGYDEGTLTLGIPAVALYDVYSAETRFMFGLPAETELRVPVLAMRF